MYLSTTLQNWIWDAVNGYTSISPEHRKKCIRNIFSGDYEIDIPVYYKVTGKEYQLPHIEILEKRNRLDYMVI